MDTMHPFHANKVRCYLPTVLTSDPRIMNKFIKKHMDGVKISIEFWSSSRFTD